MLCELNTQKLRTSHHTLVVNPRVVGLLQSHTTLTRYLEKNMSSIKSLALSFLLFTVVGTWMSANVTAQEGSEKRETATSSFTQVEFPAADELMIIGDLYLAHEDKSTPFIVLCHQANWSRGEYREIAPKLNELGFNCLAIDQRSGKSVNDIDNLSVKKAREAKKGTDFPDAEQDMIAALKWAKENHAEGKLILWGSSYSAALSLRIAGENPDLVDGALAFSPGEYFTRFGKSGDWIATSAKKIADPVFITSARQEYQAWKAIFKSIPGESKANFRPETAGNHGSRALWEKFSDNDAYWSAVKEFLKQFES